MRPTGLVASIMLGKLGCVAKIVGNGSEALQALTTGEYDAILMDCHMPVMDGFEATRMIRRTEGGKQTSHDHRHDRECAAG